MPPTSDEIQAARQTFVGWLRWYMDTYPDEAPTKAALARRMDVSAAAITYLFAVGSTRAPELKTLMAAAQLTGMPIDVLLFTPPPPRGSPPPSLTARRPRTK
jgi:transcriptional regulator with XRE-family HTH domain